MRFIMEVAHIRMFEWLSLPKIDHKQRLMMGVHVHHWMKQYMPQSWQKCGFEGLKD
jgi:hypothetical protein